MAKAIDVAKYLVKLAESGDEPDPLTHLRLQKLLYYVQGWSLALRNKPIFDERIEAWAHGPVVRSLYPRLRKFGYGAISSADFGGRLTLSEEEQDHIVAVWNAYRGFSATSLREMTHKEAPWKDARRGVAPGDRCENEISLQTMKRFFKKLAD